MIGRGTILTKTELGRLAQFVYCSENVSVLEPYMQVFWTWLSCKVSLRIASPTISMIGLLVNIFTSLNILYHCPTATEEAPRWVYIACAVGVFIYQTADALDGKQMYRTNASDSLNEVIDHGFDSISSVLVTLSFSCALQLGSHPGLMFWLSMANSFTFYLTHWRTFITKTVFFGKFDVTEGQFAVIASQLATGIFGPAIWHYQVPYKSLDTSQIAVGLAFALAFVKFCTDLRAITGQKRTTLAGSDVMSPVFHISVALFMATGIMKASPSMIYQNHPCLYVLTFGLVAAKYINKFVVAKMSLTCPQVVDTVLIGPVIMLLNQYAATPVNEYFLLWLALVLAMSDVAYYIFTVCAQICDHENIYCFSVEKVIEAPGSGTNCKLK